MARREERIKGTFGNRLGRLFLAVSDAPQSTRAWARGALGEEALAEALAGVPDVNALYDRRVPGTRGNIDAVVVAPAGVFVVDAKRYKGLVRIRDRGGLFRSDRRLYVGRRDCSRLADNMDWQVDAVGAVLESVGRDEVTITPVLRIQADSDRGCWRMAVGRAEERVGLARPVTPRKAVRPRGSS